MPAPKSVENALSMIDNDKSKILGLSFPKHKISPGQEVPRADAQTPPDLAFELPNGTYMVIGLDIDAPFPSFNLLGPILHWVQPGLKSQASAGDSVALSSSDTPFVANYIGPAPPPGSSAHRYVFLLYEQPATFEGKNYAPAGGKNLSNLRRMRYDLEAFEKEAKLGPVLAANYFLCK